MTKPEEISVKDGTQGGTVHTHPAFGVVSVTHPRGEIGVLFGSDANHDECVCIKISHADLHRDLNRDWIFERDQIISFEMTHSQFISMTTSHSGRNTPITLRSIRNEQIADIAKAKPKIDVHLDEIKKSVSEQVAHVSSLIESLEQQVEEGKISKKDLKKQIFTLKCHISNIPANTEHAVKNAVVHVEAVAEEAKHEIESYVETAVRRVGLDALQDLKRIGSE